jgi:site-specific recombinase XerC
MTAPLTIVEAVEQYMTYLHEQGKSKATLYTYGMDLKQVLDYFGSDKTVQSITLPQVGKFYRSDILLKLPKGEYRADQTIRKTVRVFRMLMLWLQVEGQIEVVPIPKHVPYLLQVSRPENLPTEARSTSLPLS